jgi:plastocyanin
MTTVGVVGLVGCSKDSTTTSTNTSAPASTSAPTTAAGSGSTAAAGGAGVITVKTFTFKPSPITVKVGEKITWMNEDDILHEPTAGAPGKPGDAFKAVSLDGKGSTGTATIAKAGTYPFFCAVHESMVGEIVVT